MNSAVNSNDPHAKRRPSRTDLPAAARFLTFGCYRRFPLFRYPELCELMVKRLIFVSETYDIEIWGWVLMPNHLHLMVWAPENVSVRRVIAILKVRFAKDALKWLRHHRPIITRDLIDTKGSERFWQRGGGYDLQIWTADKLPRGVHYIHNNPVRAELVKDPLDYPWSSAREWESGKHRVIRIDHWPVDVRL